MESVQHQDSMTWLLHFTPLPDYPKSASGTVIAIEQYSRYVVYLPYNFAPTLAVIESDLVRHWFSEFAEICYQQLPDTINEHLEIYLQDMPLQFCWSIGGDKSMQSHINDAKHWLNSYLQDHAMSKLSIGDAYNLGYHVNMQTKSVTQEGQRVRFNPYQRLIDYGLYNFASNELGLDIEAPDGAPKLTNKQGASDNVIDLASYRH